MSSLRVRATAVPTEAPHLESLAIIHVSLKLVWNRGSEA